MTTKLTLSVDSAVIERAKVWAKGRQRSVSALVEDFLVRLTRDRAASEQASPWADGLYGACRPEVPLLDDTEALVADLVAQRHS